MPNVIEVDVEPDDPQRFHEVMSAERFEEFQEAASRAAGQLRGAKVWNVNSTAQGGGVAEMLRSLLGYARGGGVDARWLVVQGEPDFFTVTKRIHNLLHGSPGDGGPLDAEALAIYRGTLAAAERSLAERIRPDDVVVLHDPQTAGLVPAIGELGARVVWRCHVGTDVPNQLADEAWTALQPFLAEADALVFSRRQFVWRGFADRRVDIVAPSLDAFSPKNRDLGQREVRAILAAGGIIPDPTADGGPPIGTPARMVEDAPVPPGAAVVAQVSRWDRLKDPAGVIKGFAEHVAPAFDAHLIVAGPDSEAVTDDPEGAEVLRECVELRAGLPEAVRARVHMACLPMHSATENALMVNALQRRADVAVQKSLAEGFGLTVAEAMWKARPLVASRVGGIQDQVEHGHSGLLVGDPADLAEFGQAVLTLLEQRERAEALGRAAQQTVRERFLAPRHLCQYAELLGSLVEEGVIDRSGQAAS